MPALSSIDDRLDAIAKHPFRAKFHLRGRERAFVQLRGMTTVRRHAFDLIGKRLAPAQPYKDGKQTPWRGPRGLRRSARNGDVLPQLPAEGARDPEGAR